MSLTTMTTTAVDEEIAASDLPVLVDVWAEWCPPCKAMEPALERLEATNGDRVRVVKVNSDEHPDFAARHGVMGLPTLLLFQDGDLVKRMVGARSHALLVQELDEYLS